MKAIPISHGIECGVPVEVLWYINVRKATHQPEKAIIMSSNQASTCQKRKPMWLVQETIIAT